MPSGLADLFEETLDAARRQLEEGEEVVRSKLDQLVPEEELDHAKKASAVLSKFGLSEKVRQTSASRPLVTKQRSAGTLAASAAETLTRAAEEELLELPKRFRRPRVSRKDSLTALLGEIFERSPREHELRVASPRDA